MVNVTTHYVGCYGCTPIRKSVMSLVMTHYDFCYNSLYIVLVMMCHGDHKMKCRNICSYSLSYLYNYFIAL